MRASRPGEPEAADRRGALTRRLAALAATEPDAEGRRAALTRRLASLVASEAESRSEPDESTPEDPATAPRKGGRRQAFGRGDAEFHPGALSLVDTPRSPFSGRMLLLTGATILTALAWGYFGRLASYTSAPGKIQATGRTKVLEALEKGQVTKILVRDGEDVDKDKILVELDPTDAAAARTILDQKLTDQRAETLRRRTEIAAASAARFGATATLDTKPAIAWPASVPAVVRAREEGVAVADLSHLREQFATLLAQKHQKEAERDKYRKSIVAQEALLAVTQENLTMIEGLMNGGYNSQAKYLDTKSLLDKQNVTLAAMKGNLDNAEQAIAVIESRIKTTQATFVSTNTQAIATAEQTITDLAQKLVKAEQALANMTLRSPVKGTVHAMAVTTIGQVVKPGQQLLQVVPRGSALEIMAYVTNTEVGFIRVGAFATIKVKSFPFGTYGSIDGKVVSVANDALQTGSKETVQGASLDGDYRAATAAQKTGAIQFPITVHADRLSMRVESKDIPLTPGMQVTVEIETERRRALDYLVSPLIELFSTAAHEK